MDSAESRSFFYAPLLSPEETLYSWCAAVQQRLCTSDQDRTTKLLFGSDVGRLAHDFPAHLNRLFEQTGGLLGSPESLALNHTLLGHFSTFLDAKQATEIVVEACEGAIPHLRLRLGIVGSGLAALHRLRCCPECVSADLRMLGRAIWRTEHQLPAALICRHHRIPLRQLGYPGQPSPCERWISPGFGTEHKYTETAIGRGHATCLILRLAEFCFQSVRLHPSAMEPTTMHRLYQKAAQRFSAIRPNGRINKGTLSNALADDYYRLNDLICSSTCLATPPDLNRILEQLCGTKINQSHPLKHMMLLTLMYEEWDDFRIDLEGAQVATPETSRSPIPKLPGRSNDLGSKKQRFIQLLSDRISIATASRQVEVCRQTGTQWARQNGFPVASKPKSISPALHAAIISDLKSGKSRGTTASANGVSIASVNSALYGDASLHKVWLAGREHANRVKHRENFLRMLTSEPGLNFSSARKKLGGKWSWLIRNDRNWMNQQLKASHFSQVDQELTSRFPSA